MVYTNDLHTKRLLYYQGFSFSWLELYASEDQRVMGPNICRGLFPICHFLRAYMQTQLEN